MASSGNTSTKSEKVPRPDMSRPQYYRSHPIDDGDEIVISGMSGRFPKSRNIAEYASNLYNKVDMIEETETRWRYIDADIPKRRGRVGDIEKFDATFFGVHHMQANTMDPQCRTILEEAYMAVLDAGVNPNSIRGSRTGVYIASCFSESEKKVINDPAEQGAFAITGCSRAMYANRISYSLGLTGQSLYLDTACSSSMYGIDLAYAAMRSGEIDAAIVGGSNLILHPNVTLHYARLGVLSPTDVCAPFDQKANGYVRSEGVAAIYLQRRRDAKRVYATLVHSKTNCDGYKAEGITYPSGLVQEKLLKEFYNDVEISPDDVGYMEAHSTGTIVGDPEECCAIDNALCKKRSEPLLIGSVKSNIGHTEPTAGICSVVKVMFAFQNGQIPPNINYTSPRKTIAALNEGRMTVVSETMDLKKPYVAVNSFGFGGANAHILLKQFDKKKSTIGVPKGSLPHLCLWSGRTKKAVEKVLNKLESKPLDPEYIALLHNIQEGGIPGMVFRGYNVLDGCGSEIPASFSRDVQHYTGVKRPIVWVFSGMGSQWPGMGSALMAIPQFQQSIQRCYNALKPAGVDLVKILTSDDPGVYNNIVHSFIGIAAIQIALVDILRSLDMEPDYIIGHSTGELGCAYADGCFTAEQMMLAAYYRGKVSLENTTSKGAMAAVGLSFNAIRNMLPESIEVACHNGPDSCTISGPADDIAQFVACLKEQNIFAREVPSANIAYHSRYIAHLGKDFVKYLKHIIPNPMKRSTKWLSTSVPQRQWSRPEVMLSSAEYHTNNLLSSVLFEETSALLPQNSLTIEIAPHCLLQSILKSSSPNGVHIGLTKRNHKENHMFLLAALGKLYVNGLNIPVQMLYPKVEWPVSRGTDTISDQIEWDHRDDWEVFSFNKMISKRTGEKIFTINIKAEENRYLEGHNIDGKVLVPATFYLECVWKTFAVMNHDASFLERPVEMENVKFVRATNLTPESTVELTVMIHFATGNFEIIESDSLVVSGTIREIRDVKKPADMSVQPFDTSYGEKFNMSAKDLYQELKLRGYYYSGEFKAIESARGDGQIIRLKWGSNWVTFMDAIMQAHILTIDPRELRLPTKIQKLRIFGRHHLTVVGEKNYVDVHTSEFEKRMVGGGVELVGLEASSVQRRKPPGVPVLERYQFLPHFPTPALRIEDIGRLFIQLALENDAPSKLKVVEVMPCFAQVPVIGHFVNAIEDLPLITGEYTILSPNKYENLPPVVTMDDESFADYKNCDIVIDQTGGHAFKEVKDQSGNVFVALVLVAGKIMSIPEEFSLLATCPWVEEGLKVLILQKTDREPSTVVKYLKISSSDTEFKWLPAAQNILAKGDLVIVAENDRNNGVLGLLNCLRREYTKKAVRCVIIDDPRAPAFDPHDAFYANQLALGMAVNIYRKGHWGTYRHLRLLTEYPTVPQFHHVYGRILHRGDLSSLKWLQGRLNPQKTQIKVVYSSLNFKDVMLATGRIASNVFYKGRMIHDAALGFEFAGVHTKTGRRVMGMVEDIALSNHLEATSELTVDVPETWTLREAATVPVVYFTVYYAFFIRADIRKGKTILIHSGTGGVGLAAIRTALAYGLEVFTTVSTPEKRAFLLKTFPQLKESHIGNSRDTSFEAMIRDQTKGEGVDFVLNSLSEEKLIASVKCLGKNGVFLEIGKFDMANDNPLGLGSFLNEISFVAVLLDLVFIQRNFTVRRELCNMLSKDIARGIVQPLPSTVFPAKDMEQAFRFLASGKHIGKVLIQIRDSSESPTTLPIQVIPRVYFSSELVYVMPGGLGGFGLELVDWMVLRGARKFVLSSSRGITKGYQSFRIKNWVKYGCTIHISLANITTRRGIQALLKEAMALGPVGGIFNLAVVLRDAVFENQTIELFTESLGPKAFATKHLDELSRQLCPSIQHFVVFSSVSCGRGNAGQTNYGMANSIMERIIEDRVASGFPGKAIQWGAVGEVGLVAAMAEDKIDLEIGGTLQQRISSCLQELDTLLSCPDPLVASMVVAEKRLGQIGSESLFETVMNVLSIRDLKSVSYSSTLSELGMDSLMAVDIKQVLEQNFDLFLSPQDLRQLSLQKLQEFSQEYTQNENGVKLEIHDIREQIRTMVRNMGDEVNYDKVIVPLNKKGEAYPPIFFFSGIECSSGQVWLDLGEQVEAPSYLVQLHKTASMASLDDIAEFAFKEIMTILKPNDPFYIVAYSFGTIVAMKVVHFLEKIGSHGKLILIDGSPALLSSMFNSYVDAVDKDDMATMVLQNIISLILPEEHEENVLNEFEKIPSLESKLFAFQKYAKRQTIFSEEYILAQTKAVLQRSRLMIEMDVSTFEKISAPICLVKPTVMMMANASRDYDLNSLTEDEVTIRTLEGNHSSILENPQLPRIINEFLLIEQR